LETPSVDGPIVPGVMRGLVLERARELRLQVVERGAVPRDDLGNADEVFLTNSVRGIIPVERARLLGATSVDSGMEWSAPGVWTQGIALDLTHGLNSGPGVTQP